MAAPMNSGRVWKCPTCGRTRPGAMATNTGPICRYDLSEMRLVTVVGFSPGRGGGGFGGRPRRPGGQAFQDGPPRRPRDPNREPNGDPNAKPAQRRRRRDERPAAPPGAPADPIDENEQTVAEGEDTSEAQRPARRNRRGRRRGRRPDGTENGVVSSSDQSPPSASESSATD
jgi:hypothetical protein